MTKKKNVINDREFFPCPSEEANFTNAKIIFTSKGSL